MGALYIRNKLVLKVDSKVCIVMEQMLWLLHDYGMPLDDVDFINFDGKTMNKLLLEFLYPIISFSVTYQCLYLGKTTDDLFTGSSRVADKLADDLNGRIKLEDAGFDWKILGPDVYEVLLSVKMCLLGWLYAQCTWTKEKVRNVITRKNRLTKNMIRASAGELSSPVLQPKPQGENGDIYFQVKNDKDVLETLASRDNLVNICALFGCDAIGLKRKSSKKTVVEKNIKYVAEPIGAKKNNMCKKVVVKKNQVSVNEPTAAKKKNIGKKVDVKVHLVSVEPTSEKKEKQG
ncbi:hypothetical protein Tco_1307965 [Tanacetum coccineum]